MGSKERSPFFQTKTNYPAYSFGDKYSQVTVPPGPGTGRYLPSTSWKSGGIPGYTVSGRGNTKQLQDDSPGPGTYLPNSPQLYTSTILDPPKWSMKGKRENFAAGVVKDDAPGVGTYSPERATPQVFKSASRSSWGPPPRRASCDERTYGPGPGSYSPVKPSPNTCQKFAGYHPPLYKEETPGPQYYGVSVQYKPRSDMGGWTMRGRSAERRRPDVPGPGAHDLGRTTMGGSWR